MFPIRGKGNGPGGSFPVSDIFLHAEQTRRQTMQTSQKITVAPRGSTAMWNGDMGSGRAEAVPWKPHFMKPTVKTTVKR